MSAETDVLIQMIFETIWRRSNDARFQQQQCMKHRNYFIFTYGNYAEFYKIPKWDACGYRNSKSRILVSITKYMTNFSVIVLGKLDIRAYEKSLNVRIVCTCTVRIQILSWSEQRIVVVFGITFFDIVCVRKLRCQRLFLILFRICSVVFFFYFFFLSW